MKKRILLAEHLTVSLTILALLLGLVFASFSLTEDFLERPSRYITTDLSGQDIQFILIHILLILVSVLLSYVIYLLLTAGTRTELAVLRSVRFLADSREQYISIYETAPVPYLTINDRGEIRDPNKAALRFYGTTQENLVGKNLFSLFLLEDDEKAKKLFQYYRSNVPVDRQEIRIVAKGGVVRWVLLSVFKMKDPIGAAYTGLCSLFDITEEKRLDKAKTDFVSLASHQLRTPVATIRWYVDALISSGDSEFSDKQKKYISTLYKVNQEMIDMIDVLLNISRLETGTINPEIKQVNVATVVESILVELSPDIEKKGIRVSKQYDGNLQSMQSDPKLLRIIIHNLLTNAIKYTSEGGEVGIIFKESAWQKEIKVSDTGIGIPPGEQDKIFTKLFRASNSSSLVGTQGTGLGLYLIKSLIETLGGEISFVSEEGKGSVFTVKF